MEVRTGQVSCRPFPRKALEDQLDVRYSRLLGLDRTTPEFTQLKGECHGIAVGLAVLTCMTMEEVSAAAHQRYLGKQRQPV